MDWTSGDAPRQPVDLVLHMGAHKTGTSSIQSLLHRNRDRLVDAGVLYPQSPGRTRHSDLGLFVRTDDELSRFPLWHRQQATDPDEFRRGFERRLDEEIALAGLPRVVLSDEALYGASLPALERLRGFTDRFAGSLRVVVYLRRQDDHLVSLYAQEVKARETQRFTEWASRPRRKIYDYRTRLAAWQEHLGPMTLVVRPFERESMAEGSLYQDFLDAAGIDVRATDLRPTQERNQTLDAEAVEFLRLLNLYRVEVEDRDWRRIDNRDLVSRLAGGNGPALTLPPAALDTFMQRWEDGNRAVASELLDRQDGVLFRQPRRTGHTTTEQHLDPARLDHYLGLLELPEAIHEQLRRIVEREARNQ